MTETLTAPERERIWQNFFSAACDQRDRAAHARDVFWKEIRDRHSNESKRLSHCRVISLTSCQCGYLQRVLREAQP
jgi:hypothetical protein